MEEQISWLLELAVNPGQLESLKALISEMVESSEAELGTVSYEWFISEDERLVYNCDRYVDSRAVTTHLATFGEKFAPRFLAAVSPTRLTVFGNPNAEVREALAGFGPTYLECLDGFRR